MEDEDVEVMKEITGIQEENFEEIKSKLKEEKING